MAPRRYNSPWDKYPLPVKQKIRARRLRREREKKLPAKSNMNARGAAGTPSLIPTSRNTANNARRCADLTHEQVVQQDVSDDEDEIDRNRTQAAAVLRQALAEVSHESHLRSAAR
jgi:hypothetical protein